LTTYQYQLSNQPEKIQSQLVKHYQEELLGVYSYIQALDGKWKTAADGFFSAVSVEEYGIGRAYPTRIYRYNFLGDLHEIEFVCDSIFLECTSKLNKGDFQFAGLAEGGWYTVDVNRDLKKIHYALDDERNPYHP